jgi:hypothetical protein
MNKSTMSELRKLIEIMVADQMRKPRGPNSHDDGEDRSLDDPMPVDDDNVEVVKK